MAVVGRAPGSRGAGDGEAVPPLTCEGCGTRVLVDLGPSGVEAVGGLRASVTYADEALLVWDCPACGRTQAEDLVG